jgi:hypothetical protein
MNNPPSGPFGSLRVLSLSKDGCETPCRNPSAEPFGSETCRRAHVESLKAGLLTAEARNKDFQAVADAFPRLGEIRGKCRLAFSSEKGLKQRFAFLCQYSPFNFQPVIQFTVSTQTVN